MHLPLKQGDESSSLFGTTNLGKLSNHINQVYKSEVMHTHDLSPYGRVGVYRGVKLQSG